ncbi:MAG TPA: GntR family transcriptional regulator [Syntrophomonadaceae bacterium]|nr:GntR family transcriptional regulator [Syntrophomonadaceae bacterium]
METRSSFLPVYYRLAEDIKNKIESGELKPGDMLPSTAQLAKKYGVSHMTVRQGVSLLVNEGYIESIQGKGSFVTNPPMDKLLLNFSEENLLGSNKKIQIKLLELNIVPADEKISRKLAVKKNAKILKMKRVLSRTEGPVALDSRFLPYVKGLPLLEKEIAYAAFPDLVASHTELFSVRNKLEVSASILSKEEAELLDTKVGMPALCIEQIIYTSKKRPIGWSKMICRADRFTLTAASHPL